MILHENNYPSTILLNSYTDKLNPEQMYGDFYDFAFASLIGLLQRPLRVLEIGVSLYREGSGHAFSKLPCVDLSFPVFAVIRGLQKTI